MSDDFLLPHFGRRRTVLLWMLRSASHSDVATRSTTVRPRSLRRKSRRPSDLHLVVIDDAWLAEAIEREWKAQSQGELTVKNVAGDQFRSENAKDCDVVIFPTNWLGELAEAQIIRPLPASVLPGQVNAAASYDWNDVFGLIRREELRWGTELYAVSFGSPQLVLAYRKDLFQRMGIGGSDNLAGIQPDGCRGFQTN